MNTVDTLYSLIKRGREGKNIGIATGIDKMDECTGGIQKNIYSLVFGLSGSGKTSWVLYCNIYRPLKDNPDADINIIYYSLEMSAEILLGKLLCLYMYEEFGVIVPYTNLLSWKEILDDNINEYVMKSKKWLDSIQHKFIIHDESLNAKYFYKSIMTSLSEWGRFEKTDDNRTIYIRNNPNKLIYGIIDHAGLIKPQTGRSKKEEIDEVSSMMVGFRERCHMSWFMLMQENRNSSNMDRRKADMSESSAEDIKDSSNPYNDCDVCIAIYNPIKHKLKVHRDYIVITNTESLDPNSFRGLRDRYRSALLIKNRFGRSDVAIGLNFFGELGLFKELPKGSTITDYKPYMNLDKPLIDEEELVQEVPKKEQITFKF